MFLLLSILRRAFVACIALVLFAAIVFLSAVSYVYSGFEGNATFPVNCALVFGAAVHGGGEAGPGIERRVQTAVRLYHEKMIDVIFVSGGKGSAQQASEGEVMRKVALREGVDPEDIRTEDAATSTVENLTFAQPMMNGCTSVVGISDRYHLARIQYIAARMHWKSFATYPSDRNATRNFELRSMVREALAVVYTVLTFHPDLDAL